jgi:hypothetical protein
MKHIIKFGLTVCFAVAFVFVGCQKDDSNKYSVVLSVNNSEMGIVAGAGEYEEGTEIQIVATANKGYHFEMWSDNDSNNPRTIVVDKTIALIAFFAKGDKKMGEVGEVCEYSESVDACDLSKVLICSDINTETIYYKWEGKKYTGVDELIGDVCAIALSDNNIVINRQLSEQTKKLLESIQFNALRTCHDE